MTGLEQVLLGFKRDALVGATVVLGIRSDERGRATEAALSDELRGAGVAVAGRVVYMQLDLASLASVRSFTQVVSSKWPRAPENNGVFDLFRIGVVRNLLRFLHDSYMCS